MEKYPQSLGVGISKLILFLFCRYVMIGHHTVFGNRKMGNKNFVIFRYMLKFILILVCRHWLFWSCIYLFEIIWQKRLSLKIISVYFPVAKFSWVKVNSLEERDSVLMLKVKNKRMSCMRLFLILFISWHRGLLWCSKGALRGCYSKEKITFHCVC